MLQTVKDLVHSLVISTNQNNTNQTLPNTPFTYDQSNANPIHNQPSNIHPSRIIPPQPHLHYNHTTFNTHQLNSPPLLTSHQQQIAYANANQVERNILSRIFLSSVIVFILLEDSFLIKVSTSCAAFASFTTVSSALGFLIYSCRS